jgi:hypothetical protein
MVAIDPQILVDLTVKTGAWPTTKRVVVIRLCGKSSRLGHRD